MTKDDTARIEIRTFAKAVQRHVGSKFVLLLDCDPLTAEVVFEVLNEL